VPKTKMASLISLAYQLKDPWCSTMAITTGIQLPVRISFLRPAISGLRITLDTTVLRSMIPLKKFKLVSVLLMLPNLKRNERERFICFSKTMNKIETHILLYVVFSHSYLHQKDTHKHSPFINSHIY